jgi:hypothetical protein
MTATPKGFFDPITGQQHPLTDPSNGRVLYGCPCKWCTLEASRELARFDLAEPAPEEVVR